MLNYLNIKHSGRHHSGIDDVKNNCKIVQKLLLKGIKFDYTTKNYGKTNIFTDINVKKSLMMMSNNNKKEDDEMKIDDGNNQQN